MKEIRVVELFAGVGGFRLGLESASNSKTKYKVVWSSQWEPGSKKQYASDIYVARFGDKGHSCEDIQEVVDKNFKAIPDHDLLVGGFPCQDYSVARTLKQAQGLEGKKGVLWWSIYNILAKKGKNAPKLLFLENVDRLLKSPAKQRGRDFAIMLSSLAKLGYAVEWRVVNAADYGFPQRRRRIYIVGYKKNSATWKQISASKDKKKWIVKDGILTKALKVKIDNENIKEIEVGDDPIYVSAKFSKDMPSKSPFGNAGVMINGKVSTLDVKPDYSGDYSVLGNFLLDEKDVPEAFFIKPADYKKWEYLKGGKKADRKTKDGHIYTYSEGPMAFPDSPDKPSRTIVTGEGGTSPSRFKHVVKTKSGRLRRLTPLELERLDMFPDNHTALEGVPDVKRAFIMGNALVVGVIEKIGKSLRGAI